MDQLPLVPFHVEHVAARLLDQYGMQLIVGEMFAILIVGTLAMTIDRRKN